MARIHFIDDDMASDLLVQNLQHRGHDVERLSSVDQALESADRISASDLVVLDLIMPGSQRTPTVEPDGTRSIGMLVFRELRRLRANQPILVFTANQDPAPANVIQSDPHAKYVSKWSSPTLQEFVDIVHQMLGIMPALVLPQSIIVHGHDDKTKLEVKNYLQNTLKLPEPIVLHEQPDCGRTLIEKFEDLAAHASLAFILLTPDDRMAKARDKDDEKRRARQNVILELGFFLGLLGRQSGRILLLYKGPLELPSDLSGLVYVDIGKGVSAASDQIRREIAPLVGGDPAHWRKL